MIRTYSDPVLVSLLPLFRIACFLADIGFERRGKTDLISDDELVHLDGCKATRRLEEAVSSPFASGAFATADVGRNQGGRLGAEPVQ